MTITFHVGKPSDPTKGPRWTASGTGHRLTGPNNQPGGIRVDLGCGGPDEFGREEHFHLDGDSGEMKRFLEVAFRVVVAAEQLVEKQEREKAAALRPAHPQEK